ncbi:fungal specific transcription factor, partial [Trichoderma arundinaceum]
MVLFLYFTRIVMLSSPMKPRARLACFPCRHSKRRCDRVLPLCDNCREKSIECSYPIRRGEKRNIGLETRAATSPRPVSVITANSFYQMPRDLASASVTSVTAAAVKFIAPQVFQQTQLELPRVNPSIPGDVITYVGDVPTSRNVAAIFFKTIHTWIPIFSRKRFFNNILNPLSQWDPERILLILSMKLCCQPLSNDGDDGRSPLYRAIKNFHYEMEAAGVLSIHVLQANILIAVYEMAQAIYPVAFLTVGACARYGMALGIDKLEEESQYPWPETEEKRRAWWAILALDRYLPIDDDAWDQVIAKPSDAVRLSAGFHLKMGFFARVAQATYLLSQALNSTLSPFHVGQIHARCVDTIQLRRTLSALVKTADTEAAVRQLEFCPQSSICYSAILLLQTHHAQIQAHESNNTASAFAEHLSAEAESALESLSNLAKKLCEEWEQRSIADCASLFLMQVIYQAASTLLRVSTGNPNTTTQGRIEALTELLRRLSRRWRVA